MSFAGVNLASRPFSNQAPVLRTTIGLSVLVVTLLVVNIALYWSYFSGSGEEARAELVRLDDRIAKSEAELVELDREISGYDLEALRAQVEFLNLRIAERSFGWGRLFEDLGEVLPAQVRLERLSPSLGRFRAASGGAPSSVLLTIEGAAKEGEALLNFIDALFEHPRFEDPNPSRESQRQGGLRFGLTVIYKPPVKGRAAPAAEDS